MRLGAFLLTALLPCAAFGGMTSSNYEIAVWALDGGGETGASTDYSLLTATMQAGEIGVSTSTHYAANYGVISQQYEALPPSRPGVVVSPVSPMTTDDLICTVTVPTHVAPGLPAKYEYSWSNGINTIVHGPTLATADALSSAFTLKHQTWTCSVRGYDGRSYSPAAGMDTVTTINTPPGPLSFTIPSIESTSVNLRCYFIKSADPDNDIVYSTKWYVQRSGAPSAILWTGDMIVTDSLTQIDASDTESGDIWTCKVTYGDGEESAITAVSSSCLIVSGGITTSYLFLSSGSTVITLGQSITLSGMVMPVPADPDRRIRFFTTPPNGSMSEFPEDIGYGVYTGDFSRTFYPSQASEGRSDWRTYAYWSGDSIYSEATSSTVTYTVLKAQPTLSLSVSPGAILVNESGVSATATLSASLPDILKPLLANQPIKLYLRRPDGSSAGPVIMNTDSNGVASFSPSDFSSAGISFNTAGTWQFLAEFDASDNFLHATSANYDTPQAARLTVKDGAGYAVVVVGKLNAGAEGQASHAKTADFVYRSLRDRGFAPDDIYYLREGPVQPQSDIFVDDTTPTKAEVQQALTTWAKERMNATPAPLYVVLLDHGGMDSFYVYSGSYDPVQRIITPVELSNWLDALQTGLEGPAQTEDIVLIDGACHSGSFIDEVSGPHRTIITSSSAEEISHRGVKDPGNVNDVRDGEPFVTELFRNLREGKTLKASFETASRKIEEFTASRSNGIGPQYLPQHPLLDDNGDAEGSTWASLAYEAGYDGAQSHGVVLGFGVNAGEEIGWIEASQTIVAAAGDPVEVFARATLPGGSYSAWIEVKTPEYAGAEPADATLPEFQQVVSMPRFNFEPGISDVAGTGTYRWRDGFGNLFDTEGTYKIYYYIKAPDTAQKMGETSAYLLTTVYRIKTDNQPPTAVELVYPEAGANVPTYSFFAWSESTDPDGDPITYRFELAKDAEFTVGVRYKDLLESTFFQVTELEPELGTCYWRVIPIDQYGARPADNAVGTVLFTGNPSTTGSILGQVRDISTNLVLEGVVLSLRQNGQVKATCQTDRRGEYFRGGLAPGAYVLEAAKDGYETRTLAVTVLEDNDVEQDVQLTPSSGGAYRWGELSGDGRTGTVDASEISQWRVRLITEFPAYPGIVRPLYPDASDVNGDGFLNEMDASDILRWKVGLISALPADCDGNEYGPDTGCKSATEVSAADTRRYVSLPERTVDPDTDIALDVALDSAADVRAYFLDITYAEDVLEYQGLDLGNLTQGWGLPIINDLAGELLVSGTSPTATSGSGVLVTLRFRVRDTASGRTTPLHFVSVELNGTQIPVTATDGAITVTGTLPEGEGMTEGLQEGTTEGTAEGVIEGQAEGSAEGTEEGSPEGSTTEGISEGMTEGDIEGGPEGEGALEGEVTPPFGCTCTKTDLGWPGFEQLLGDLFLFGMSLLVLAGTGQFMRRQ